MFDHVELPVSDLAASAAFYGRVLEPLGLSVSEADESVEFGALTLVPRRPLDRVHIAFVAETREEVDAFHLAGVEAGFRSNGAPGVRERYAPDYYAAYLLDPDGHNIEAVHRAVEMRMQWPWLGRGLP